MAAQANQTAEVISLPKGGGALHGIGEKFSPNLHTGTGNFTVPIAIPAGRNGFQPELNLVYSTGNGNGVFGLGWALSVPGVSRKTSKGVPRYDDSDVFLLSGAEDLVPVAEQREDSPIESKTTTQFRPRTEGLFARILHHRISPKESEFIEDYWEVRSKDGLVSFYGAVPETASYTTEPVEAAIIEDPQDSLGRRIFGWKLVRTVDPFGNRIDYEYERDRGQDGPHSWDQLYLRTISYADYGDPTNPNFLVSVELEYEERPDPFSEYRTGFEIRTRRRCTSIRIHSHTDKDRLQRSFRFVYLDQIPAPSTSSPRLPINGTSLLHQIQVTGHDGSETESLPPLTFGYTKFSPEKRDFFPVDGKGLPARSLANQELALVDLFGNGLPDIIELSGVARYWRNLGNGRFDMSRLMANAPSGLRLADRGVQLIDADGDGRVDLMVSKPGLAGFFPLSLHGTWDAKSFRRYATAPSFDLEDPLVDLVDLDGDGITDAIRSGTRLECFFNDREAGWSKTRWVERQAPETFPDVDFSDSRVRWADMAGDGLRDIVLIANGSISYWPSLGHGNWGPRLVMGNSPRLPQGHNPKRILLGDIDGDGLADLIYVDDTRVTLWINQSGNRWSDPIEVQGTPPVADMDAVRLVDLLGTGVSGILWTRDADALGNETMHFLDFTGGAKPYLLERMDNRMGAVTRVAYAPSTRFYLEDERRPESRWQTPLPFPVHVVAGVEVIDEISGGKLATEYRYHHGYWDGGEREFRGFGMVEQYDTESFDKYYRPGLHGQGTPFNQVADKRFFSPPTLTKTWFHQGPVGEEFGDWDELDYRKAYWAGDPPFLQESETMRDLLARLPRRARRDALRALRGRVLRSELYALDGSEREDRPYRVTESTHGVCLVAEEKGRPRLTWSGLESESSPGPDSPRPVFFPHRLAVRTTQWERGEDPLTRFGFTDEYDDYGQVRCRIDIACPRGWGSENDSAGDGYLATFSETVYAQRDDTDAFMVDRVAKVTTYEITDRRDLGVLELAHEVLNRQVSISLIGQTLNFYDGEAFTGQSLGVLGDFGALTRSERLVLTEDIIGRTYPIEDSPPDDGGPPPYLVHESAELSADCPPDFRDQLPLRAGYIYRDGPDAAKGYFVVTDQRCHDFQTSHPVTPRGLVMASRDPLGHEGTVAYEFDLLPVEATDPAGMTTRASYDHRILQPSLVTDPNGNRRRVGYTPLGLVGWLAVMGKEGEPVGDIPEQPGVRFLYDFLAFERDRRPSAAHSITREQHRWDLIARENEERRQQGLAALSEVEVDAMFPEDEVEQSPDCFIQSITYSDGFGRVIQAREQAEDTLFGDTSFGTDVLPSDQSDETGTMAAVVGRERAPEDPVNVVVSGWKTYDNKGRVVEQYEPFFSEGWDYRSPSLEHDTFQREVLGQKSTLYYDPLGRMIRTVNPNGSEQRVVQGVPRILAEPDDFAPTPWEAHTYDANDNAGRTHRGTASAFRTHWDTPTSILIDALGRTIRSVERNGADPDTDWYSTRSTYDIRGNLLTITDPMGREAFRYVYDIADQALRTESIDAGVRRAVLDAAGNEIERRDSKGALVLQAFDALNRPTHLWARDRNGEPITLRQHLIYGDSDEANLSRTVAEALNLLGMPHKQYDEAGLLRFEAYDFKGNLLEKVRRVVNDTAILSVFPDKDDPSPSWQIQPFRVDWTPPPGGTLQARAEEQLNTDEYRTSQTYDALNRITLLRYPQDVEGERRESRPLYNRAGNLERITLVDQIYVDRIAYNAKGQRTIIVYGNGLMTRYAYDPFTFRLARLRTERYAPTDALTYRPTGEPLQDFAYNYDLAGNILSIRDRTPGCGIPNTFSGTDALDREFIYDPLYRLLSATGRECDHPPETPPWDDRPRCTDLTRTRAYTEQYTYDSVGNLLRLAHGIEDGGFVRAFSPARGSNRLETRTIGQDVFPYRYDSNGNLVEESRSRHFEWDHSDHMRAFRIQPTESEPSIHASYLYDSSGQRVKKLVRKQGGVISATVYVDSVFEHQFLMHGGTNQENNTLHIMDDQGRIALVRVGNSFTDDDTPAVKYQLGDHLGSTNLVTDGVGAWIEREEYSPYGETSFGKFARKQYRFTGKERDEESSLYYHGARYYAPWVVRWTSTDPVQVTDGISLYEYVRSNPLRLIDPSGANSEDGSVISVDVDQAVLKSRNRQAAARRKSSDSPNNADTDPPDDTSAGAISYASKAASLMNFITAGKVITAAKVGADIALEAYRSSAIKAADSAAATARAIEVKNNKKWYELGKSASRLGKTLLKWRYHWNISEYDPRFLLPLKSKQLARIEAVRHSTLQAGLREANNVWQKSFNAGMSKVTFAAKLNMVFNALGLGVSSYQLYQAIENKNLEQALGASANVVAGIVGFLPPYGMVGSAFYGGITLLDSITSGGVSRPYRDAGVYVASVVRNVGGGEVLGDITGAGLTAYGMMSLIHPVGLVVGVAAFLGSWVTQ